MADFLRRLAERALGVAVVAQPAIAPRFASGPSLAVESSAIEAPGVPSHHEPPRSSPSPDVETRRVEVDVQKPAARLEERIPALLPVHAETVRIGDLPQRALETKVQVTEPRGQPDIAPPVPRPGLRLEAFDARPEPRPPMFQPPARNDLEATRVEAFDARPEPRPPMFEPPARNDLEALRVEPIRAEPKETVEAKPVVVPHPTMPPVPSREGQPLSSGRQSSRVEEPETPEPIVRVSIGRVEVRAVFPEQPQLQRAPLPRSSSLSLSEYLKQRDGGMR